MVDSLKADRPHTRLKQQTKVISASYEIFFSSYHDRLMQPSDDSVDVMITTQARILSGWTDIINAKTEVWWVPELGNIKQHSN